MLKILKSAKKKFVLKVNDLVSERQREFLKRIGFQRLFNFVIEKSEGELIFQTRWVEKFTKNKKKVNEYWQKYLYLEQIKKICKMNSKVRILDIGCGISTVLHFLEGERYGIDPLASEYKKIYKYPKELKIVKAQGEKLPFNKGFFDVVFCSNVLDHVDVPALTVREIKRVLKNRGYFVLTVHFFENKFERDPAHPHTFTKNNVFNLLKGFKIVFQKESPAIGFYDYVLKKSKTSRFKELILVTRKVI